MVGMSDKVFIVQTHSNAFMAYRTRAIITRSRFETALDYKPRIFEVRKVSLYYKPLCSINRGLYNYQKIMFLIVAAKVFSFLTIFVVVAFLSIFPHAAKYNLHTQLCTDTL